MMTDAEQDRIEAAQHAEEFPTEFSLLAAEVRRTSGRYALCKINAANATRDLYASRKAYGAALRAMREAQEITLRQVSAEIGLTASFISNCEVGRRRYWFSPEKEAAYLDVVNPEPAPTGP